MGRTTRSVVQSKFHRQEGEHEKVKLGGGHSTMESLECNSCPGLATYSVTLGKVCSSVSKIYSKNITYFTWQV